jgi:ankyrin repeat protein
MSVSNLEEEPVFLEDPNQNPQAQDGLKDDEATSSDSEDDDAEDDQGDDTDERSTQESVQNKLDEIIKDLRAGAPSKVISGKFDLTKRGDLAKFMKENEAYLDKETHPKRQNLLHLIAEETDKDVLSLIKKMKLLVKALVKLPGNLLSKKDAYGKTPVHTALSLRNHRLVRYMCEEHEDMNSILRIPTMQSRQHSANCLHLAIKNKGSSKDDELLLLLIQKSKEDTLCAVDEQGLTPLHLAVAYERCDEAQLAIVQTLVAKCDAAVDIMYKQGDKGLFSPYRYHVLTEQEATTTQGNKGKAERPPKREDPEIKESNLVDPYRKDDKKTDTSADKEKSQPSSQESRNPVATKPRQADPTAVPTGKYNTLSKSSRGPLGPATSNDSAGGNGMPPTPVDGERKKTTSKRSQGSKAPPTEASAQAIKQYLKEYCLRTRDHEKAVELLYGAQQGKFDKLLAL